MPIKIPDSLPATAVLESENIFVMTEYRAMHRMANPTANQAANRGTNCVTNPTIFQAMPRTQRQTSVRRRVIMQRMTGGENNGRHRT